MTKQSLGHLSGSSSPLYLLLGARSSHIQHLTRSLRDFHQDVVTVARAPSEQNFLSDDGSFDASSYPSYSDPWVTSDFSSHHFPDEILNRLSEYGLIRKPVVVVLGAAEAGPLGAMCECSAEDLLLYLSDSIRITHNVLCGLGSRLPGGSRIILLMGGGVGGDKLTQGADAYVASKAITGVLIELASRQIPRDFGKGIFGVSPGPYPSMLASQIAGAVDANDGVWSEEDLRLREHRLAKMVQFLAGPMAHHLSGSLLSAQHDDLDSLQRLCDAVAAGMYDRDGILPLMRRRSPSSLSAHAL